MSRFVIDASTGAKWFLSEVHSGAARRLLSAKHDLLVPDLFWPERDERDIYRGLELPALERILAKGHRDRSEVRSAEFWLGVT